MSTTSEVAASYVVYMLTFPNGKRYVGYTGNFRTRMSGHAHNARANRGDTALYRAIRKYGWENVEKRIIASADSLYLILQLEIFCAEFWGTYSPVGYNTIPAGQVSPMTVASVRAKLKGRPRPQSVKDALRAYHTGRPTSETTKLKLSISTKGRPKSEDTKQRMRIAAKLRQRDSATGLFK